MTDQPIKSPAAASPAQASGPTEQFPLFPIPRSWKVGAVVAVIMVLLALLGVALTNNSSSAAPAFWISLVPIYGLLCVSTAWARTAHDRTARGPAVIRQLFHWSGIGVALGMDFLIRKSGEETGTAAGMNALLLLALGCYLAGVHLEWLFAIVGVLLTLALVVVAKAEQYMWLILVVGVIAIVALFVFRWALAKTQPAKAVGSK